ncbi:alpha-amylase/4-alpha-glucanotransferase domain-containing protein [Lignipirellula cremea]|uniref:Alpha-amylase 1 n=1 Tax=Lignipirellula cremea TaxID=2528010 RepID=A0A518E529_9BACT|nr:alpha-amylase/4-alpha-glucanotransferase domain-containing protein [Lignipirellula cremea]QDU99178.1 Alpha-amylase 1 [Lignipirellula cremea]
MNPTIRLCLVLHNHQPIGNFDGVFEQAYQDSYLPFLEVFEDYSDLKISLHTSGPLMEWLDERHPEYLDRVAALVAEDRIEIIGGSFYEAILTMIPQRDRVGQIATYTAWLEDRLGGKVRGMWTPERVWEQSLTTAIAEAGIEYTVLDDFHFRNAGLADDKLHGYYVTEDDGRVLCVFPGSEQLRYFIPFQDPDRIIEHLRHLGEVSPGAVAVFGDDGEKFGTWPDTKKHVYDNGWLRKFFDALTLHRDWLSTTTLADAIDNTPAKGKVYLPDGSYREMTEWALPVAKQEEYDDVVHDMQHDARWARMRQFMRGGFWRNFKVKYPEANEMYARMMMVSQRLAEAEAQGASGETIEAARRELYRGQCNCSYWHGAFGGIYLPHLRNAVYSRLIAADKLLDEAEQKTAPWIEAAAADLNFDARPEIRLSSDKLTCLLEPASGGRLYELDIRSICHNLAASITRRPESYHRKVLQGANAGSDNVASIHDRVVFKQEGLDQRLQYDKQPRKSLVDHFYDNEATLAAVRDGRANERGDFAEGEYEAKIRRNPDRIQVQLSRQGNAWGIPLRITKGVTLTAGDSELRIAYLLEGLPRDKSLHFAVEFNLAGLPSGADDRYFLSQNVKLGQLGAQLDLRDAQELALCDEWLGLKVQLNTNRPTHIWTFPVETVSQSEGGFELVHQSVSVQPHWFVQGDADGRWSTELTLKMDTSQAESRAAALETAAAGLHD